MYKARIDTVTRISGAVPSATGFEIVHSVEDALEELPGAKDQMQADRNADCRDASALSQHLRQQTRGVPVATRMLRVRGSSLRRCANVRSRSISARCACPRAFVVPDQSVDGTHEGRVSLRDLGAAATGLEEQADHREHAVKQIVDVRRVRDQNLVDLGVPDHERVADIRERDGFFLQPCA